MATFGSFTEIEAARSAVATHIDNATQRLNNSLAEFSRIDAMMTAIAAEYGAIVQAAEDLLATNPSDPGYILLNSNVQHHLADFNAVQARAQAANTAVLSI